MDSIVKTFFGKHIDLDKVIAVSDVELAGYQLTFHIECQFRDTPIVYNETVSYDKLEGLSGKLYWDKIEDERKLLQEKVDVLVEQLKLWTRNRRIEERMALEGQNKNFIETQYPADEWPHRNPIFSDAPGVIDPIKKK